MAGSGSDFRRWNAYYFGLPPSPEMLRGFFLIYIVSFWVIGHVMNEQEKLADGLYALLCLSLVGLYYMHVRSYYCEPPGPVTYQNGILSVPAPLLKDRQARQIELQKIDKVVLRTYQSCPVFVQFYSGREQFTVYTSSMIKSPDFGKFLAAMVKKTEKRPISQIKFMIFMLILLLVILAPLLIPKFSQFSF